jgi:hypothetical protein
MVVTRGCHPWLMAARNGGAMPQAARSASRHMSAILQKFSADARLSP